MESLVAFVGAMRAHGWFWIAAFLGAVQFIEYLRVPEWIPYGAKVNKVIVLLRTRRAFGVACVVALLMAAFGVFDEQFSKVRQLQLGAAALESEKTSAESRANKKDEEFGSLFRTSLSLDRDQDQEIARLRILESEYRGRLASLESENRRLIGLLEEKAARAQTNYSFQGIGRLAQIGRSMRTRPAREISISGGD